MKKLQLLLIGDNDIARLCFEEAQSAGHNFSKYSKCDGELPILDDKEVIPVFCSAGDDIGSISMQANVSLIFNYQLLETLNDLLAGSNKKHACVWHIATCKNNYSRPFIIDLSGLTSIEEVVRESFAEILSHISRDTLQESQSYTKYHGPYGLPARTSSHPIFFQNLWDAFSHSVTKYPSHIAVVYEDISINYQELFNLALHAANQIRENCSDSKPIVLYFKRNINMIVSLLAVLKLDRTYVPIDPKNPLSRTQLMLEDCKANLILCDSETMSNVKDISPHISLQCIDWKQYDKNTCSSQILSLHNEIAYIIYTSGSTGHPKGVMCTHKGALNMVLWTIQHYPIGHEDRIAQLASYAFDISVWEIFSALLSGATLVLAKDDGYAEPKYMVDFIAANKITVAHMIPTILNLFLDESVDEHSTLKHLVSGGEELRPSIADKFFNKIPLCNLYHGYGPTESAITCIHHKVNQGSYKNFIPIGRPIQNTGLYLLDKYMQSISLHEEGELYVSGFGIASGYLNNPIQTRERFILSPFNPDEILYKTGDVVKADSEGLLQYIGRVDNQIKIRGNRVELEEIERVLSQYPSLKVCSVQLLNSYQPILVAFCVFDGQDDESIDIRNAKKWLQSLLPAYMIPEQFIAINDLPRNTNGKIDKQKLYLYFSNMTNTNISVVNSMSDTESKITYFMNSVLHLRIDNLTDDLMSLGVNSLSIIYLLNFIEKTFSLRMSPIEIFQLGTLKNIADVVERKKVNCDKFIGQSITRVSRNITLPLSNAQARLWFLHQLENQESSAYNIFKLYELKGKPDLKRLEHSFNKVIARHEPLRTLFRSVNGKPHQVVCDAYHISIPLEITNSDILPDKLLEFGNTYFDLNNKFAFKVKLFFIEDKQYYLLTLLQHNIITDGWSTGILIKELSQYYNNPDESNVSAKLNIQLVDYALWQGKRLSNNLLKSELEYWRNKLANFSKLNFPLDVSRPTRQAFNGRIESIVIDGNQIKLIDDFIKSKKVTLYTYLVAALKVLFYRYTNQSDIVIGTGYAGRDKAELKDIMGFFINTVPLRTEFDEYDSFLDALEKTKKTILDAISHSEIPFDVLVDKLNIEREPNCSPIFQILFLMQDAADNITLKLDDINVREINFDLGVSIFDMTFNVTKESDQLMIAVQYNTDLFKKESISQLLIHYKEILHRVIESPDAIIKKIPIINEYDLSIIKNINPHQSIGSSHKSILDLFNHAVIKYSDRIALVEDKTKLITYNTLDKLATDLANFICQKYGTGNLIGIYMKKSIPLFVSMLAILRSGNAYLLLDIETPENRLNYMLQNSRAVFVIYHDKIPLVSAITSQLIAYSDAMNMHCPSCKVVIHGTDNCYVLYTSGSTGEPKGVQITHHNLVNTLIFFTRYFNTNEKYHLLSLTSPNFDIFQLEAYLSLLSGGTCYFFTNSLNESLNEILELIIEAKPSLIQATPSVCKLLLQFAKSPFANTDILVGGETLDRELLKLLHQYFRKVHHVYGPTETTIWSTYADLTESENVNIGCSIDNTLTLVVDKNNQLLPAGCVGELIISGNSVSPGYINNASESEKRFISLAYVNLYDGVRRFYKTGDLARIAHDGHIQYIGREDDQVKIRGHRIELNEIVSTIKRHPLVNDILVIPMTREDNIYDQVMVGFVMPTDFTISQEQLGIDLSRFARLYLPDYMVPSVYIKIESVPLNTNGKADKHALKSMYRTSYFNNIDSSKCLTITKVESEIMDIWSKALQLSNPDIYASFFNLGGSSLLIAEIVAAINDHFESSITIREFVNNPTITDLAKLIEDLESTITN
jgi:amino acid adenylation domain-containing protein